MNIWILISLALFNQCLYATQVASEPQRGIPELTPENLRWHVPADGWRFKKQHDFKGRYFKISSWVDYPLSKNVFSSLKLYKNSKMEGKPSLEISDRIFLDGKEICNSFIYERKSLDPKNVIGCSWGNCFLLSSNNAIDNFKLNPFSDADFLLNQTEYRKQCPIKLDYIQKKFLSSDSNQDSIYEFLKITSNSDVGYNYYFKSEGYSKENNYLKVQVNGEVHYLDTHICKDYPANCLEVEIRVSDYEKDWIKLEMHKEKKDIDILNVLIEELKPCVHKRDVSCIKRFFPDPVNDDYLIDWYEGYKIPNIVVNEELINELKACLDYASLLPHLYGSRGVNKVCIFSIRGDRALKNKKKAKILNVEYPEAVRVKDGFPIYLYAR